MGDLGKDAACCRTGKAWEGTPAGKEIKLGGLDAYLSEPDQPSDGKAVLLIADIHGWDFKNARLVADALADAGFLAVLPDFFHGDKFPSPVTPELFQQWLERNPMSLEPGSRTLEDLDAVIGALRADHGVTSLGTQGFCWGGFYSVHLTSQDKVRTAIIAHGSRLEHPMIERIEKPVLFTCPEHDSQMSAEFRGDIKKELATKDFASRVDVYKGVGHGFTLRPDLKGDASDEALLKESAKALQASIAWFKERL